MIVGGAQSVDVCAPRCASVRQARATPRKARALHLFQEEIRREARMAAVSVRVRVNLNESVMEARGDLVVRIRLMLDPIGAVIYELLQIHGDAVRIDADVLPCPPVATRPFPDIAEHAGVQSIEKFRIQHIARALDRPVFRLEDVGLLGRVEIATRRDI